MSQIPDDVMKILAQASGMSDGPTKIEVIQEAVRLADAANNVDAGFHTRLALQEAALTCGSADILLVAYTWCLSQAEKQPNRFGFHQVLWRYRWAIIYLPTFPEIPRRKIEDALADMTRRYEVANASLRPVHMLRWKVAMKLGDAAMAAEARNAFLHTRRDWLSDDEQTETVTQIDDHLFHERWGEAAIAAKPFLEGTITREGYLDTVLSWMPVPLLRLGRIEQAMAVHERGYRLTIQNAALVTQAGRHVQYLALTHNFPRAIRLIERYLPYCAGSDPEDQVEFYPCLWTLLRMMQIAGRTSVRLRLVPHCPGYRAEGEYELPELERVYHVAAAAVAARYDRRNGNDYYARFLNELTEITQLSRPFPIVALDAER